MSEPSKTPPPPEDSPRPADEAPPGSPRADDEAPPDATDLRMADVLRSSSTSNSELRAQLHRDDSTEASDMLARLDALDFVNEVVGSPADVPTQIGNYAIKGVLGRGGMGTVYLAWQPELEREVALKVLSPTYSSDLTMRKRFRAEARATAALHHRHIVPIYDYGEARGVLFFAMERVDGMSLDKHILAARRGERKPLEPLDAARRFAGVADALGLAHRRRLLHRDVKPGNILVAADGTFALTDFGLAKALDHASMRLTSKGGGFLGTLHYSSPEQAMGDELTPASDLYSLGVTIFETIAGELPIAGKTTEALLQSILHGTPRRLRECVPNPPRDLEAVLDKLMSREPRDRYQDGEELARDLQRIADGEPVHIRRLPLHVRLWRRARKNPVLAGAIVAVFVLTLLTLTLLTVWRRERGQTFVLRHQGHLVAVAVDIARERGSPWGAPGLLVSLVGEDLGAEPANDQVLRSLARASSELPDDPMVEAMRRAYVDEPQPTGVLLLREGRGYEALRLYDAAIAQALQARAGGALDVELRLFRLFLARGIANLTAAVARPNDARTDLALAAYLRPGAVFPKALLDVIDLLDVARGADPEPVVQRLERELAAADAERRKVIGLLLWNAAGLRPVRQANLMEFRLGYPARAALHGLATRLLDEPPRDCVATGQPTGLAARFATECRAALGQGNDPSALREAITRLDLAIGQSVHPEAPLQAWRSLLQLLQQRDRRTGPLLDREQRVLSPELQLQAWRDLLQLDPPQPLLALWLPRFAELAQDHPNLPGMARAGAQMHLLAGSPDAVAYAGAWVAEADGDPDAQLWRMRALLARGAVADARDDAIVAVQQSVAPLETLREVVRVCQLAATGLDGGLTEEVQLMTRKFRDLLDRGGLTGGGPR
ncbi:MAG: serine/threonine protein kinase [Planctomycetes bacterium]|nr:serine/threonine protein kinase [Planctomycetota bacterium]